MSHESRQVKLCTKAYFISIGFVEADLQGPEVSVIFMHHTCKFDAIYACSL